MDPQVARAIAAIGDVVGTDDRLLGEHIARFVGAHAAAREPSAAG